MIQDVGVGGTEPSVSTIFFTYIRAGLLLPRSL
jgi:hypothetical protein